MSDITYAEVEIVRFMKPKIRTRHQRPKNKLTRTPFDRCRSWYAEVDMFVQGGERREGVDIELAHFNLAGSWLLEGRGEVGGAEVDSNSGKA